MTLFDIAEKAESIRDSADKIIDAKQAAEKRERKLFLIAMGVMMSLSMVFSYLSSQRIEGRINQPQPAVVKLTLTSAADNPILCPGDIFRYTVSLDITEPLTGRAVVVVRNLDTKRQEFSASSDVIYHVDQRTTDVPWQVPLFLPATSARPERQWTAGNYAREIAIVSYEANQQAEPQAVPFRIGANCSGVVGS